MASLGYFMSFQCLCHYINLSHLYSRSSSCQVASRNSSVLHFLITNEGQRMHFVMTNKNFQIRKHLNHCLGPWFVSLQECPHHLSPHRKSHNHQTRQPILQLHQLMISEAFCLMRVAQ
uniref:Uncharacterized protein n=1 Tax=Opuntia streptacantha TaxID=393608 RepID=A0A7C8ZB78_OPUST